MFEEEAEERARKLEEKQTLGVYDNDEDLARDEGFNEGEVVGYEQGFKDGAELGYNKANEWHDLRKNPNDLPPKELEEKQLLIRVRKYTEDYILAYYMLDPYYSKNGKRFYSDTDCECPINIKNVIAWKQIVPPKLKESEK